MDTIHGVVEISSGFPLHRFFRKKKTIYRKNVMKEDPLTLRAPKDDICMTIHIS